MACKILREKRTVANIGMERARTGDNSENISYLECVATPQEKYEAEFLNCGT